MLYKPALLAAFFLPDIVYILLSFLTRVRPSPPAPDSFTSNSGKGRSDSTETGGRRW